MERVKVVFLILPKVHLIDLAGPVQVFHEALDYGANIELDYCSIEEELSASTRIHLGKLKHFSQVTLNAGDYLFIPGTEVKTLLSKRISSEKHLFHWVNKGYDSGATICSICTGAFFLGMAALLNGRKCTTHWKRTKELKSRFPAIKLMDDVLFTEDERIFTSAGVTAGVDLALFILGRLTNDNISYKVARELVVYVRRNGADSQQSIFMKYRNHVHAGVHTVQDFVHQNIQKKVSLPHLADKACMSIRTLTRTFKRETGITVNEYATLVRRELLKEFIRNPDMSRKQMARLCGLKSERQVIRLLQRTS